MSRKKGDALKGEVLVALLKGKADFAILQEQAWYRIPVEHAPGRWPPNVLAFYQPRAFGPEAFQVRYYGEVDEIQVVKRGVLFPNEFTSTRSDREYYRISLKTLESLTQPILSYRHRRLLFIPTTWYKFSRAEQINDLFDESPLEDRMWSEFKRWQIMAERQWYLPFKLKHYLLDFALFCIKGCIDIETDGDQWHAKPERIPLDNQRDNALQSMGWHVLRFNGKQIAEEAGEYCLANVQETINALGGLSDEGLVPRVFYPDSGETATQLSMFERQESYGYDSGAAYNLEIDENLRE